MHRPTFAAILLSTTLAAGSAWAQASNPSTPAAPAAPAATAATSPGKFVTAQGNGEFRASKFVGIDVYGSEGEKIGDISEILIDGQGDAKAVVVGVGGFLGIGQKNVAVPWSSVTWSNEPAKTASSGSAATGSASPMAGGSTSSGTGGSGSMGSAGAPPRPAAAPARSPAEQAAYNGYPDHAKVQLTKAELNDAPAFKYVSDAASAGSTTK